jgi:hypothetical protein
MNTHHKKHAATPHAGSNGPATTTKPAVTSSEKKPKTQLISAEEIRLCAYRKWEGAGKPTGDGIQFWLEAEHELVKG